MTNQEKPKCVYKRMQEDPNSTTFREPINSELRKCIFCNGYDENCFIYTDMRRFMNKCYEARDRCKQELKEKGK